MNTLKKINTVDVETLLKNLWIKYKKQWATLALYDWGDFTWWWKVNKTEWIFKDFSDKWRAEWDRLKFVEMYLWLNKHDALLWFEEAFGWQNTYKNDKAMVTKKVNTMNKKWERLETLSEKQIEYLKWRGINISSLNGVVKNNDWKVSMPIYTDLNGTIWALQSRDINGYGRYYLDKPKDWSADWVFYNSLDEKHQWIIVVEWFTDFLSIRQYTNNVVWLLNAWNEHQIDIIKELSMKYKIIFCPDNDESWKKSIKNMKEKGVDFYLFDVWSFWVKDVNEYLNTFWLDEKIIWSIRENATPPETNIRKALRRARENQKKSRIEIWDKVLDGECRWFRRWTTVLINGQSTWGKTTFSLYILINLLKNTNYRINYYSLETDIWEQIISILSYYFWRTEQDVYENLDEFDLDMFEWRLFIYDDIREYHNVTAHITKTMPDVFFIDYVQKLKIDSIYDETQKMVFYAQEMQNYLIDNWHSIGISLSQVAMSNYNAPLIQRTPKNSGALLEASDVVINVGKEDGKYRIAFYKCKWGIGWWKVFDTFYNHNPREYGIFPELRDDIIESSKPKSPKGFKDF